MTRREAHDLAGRPRRGGDIRAGCPRRGQGFLSERGGPRRAEPPPPRQGSLFQPSELATCQLSNRGSSVVCVGLIGLLL